MSTESLERAGWVLVATSIACLAALQWVVLRNVGQWDAWEVAGLMHGAMATGMVAHGLTWRRGSASLRALAQIMAWASVVGWMYTWFEPLAELTAWFQSLALGWFAP